MSFKVQFPFSVRQGLKMAQIVADFLNGNRPVALMSIRGETTAPVFHFEGGTVIQVLLENLITDELSLPRESWAVNGLRVRYYRKDGDSQKVMEDWDARDILRALNQIDRSRFPGFPSSMPGVVDNTFAYHRAAGVLAHCAASWQQRIDFSRKEGLEDVATREEAARDAELANLRVREVFGYIPYVR